MRIARAAVPLLGTLLAGCGTADEDRVLAANPLCRAVQSPVQLPLEVPEASGVAVSRTHAGTLWMHNDSGNEPVLFAIDATGAVVARVEVSGGAGVMDDWEDLALAACGGADCLYIGDIGDNEGAREEIVVRRLPEPALAATTTGPPVAFRARFPGGPRDAEALFVLPEERIFIVTKGRSSAIELYAFPTPLPGTGAATLELVGSLSGGPVPLGDQVTGAAASPDGAWVALRTYTSLLVYPAERLLAGDDTPAIHVDLRPLAEPQGEGVALGPEGSVALVSEGATGGLPGTFSLVWCADLAG